MAATSAGEKKRSGDFLGGEVLADLLDVHAHVAPERDRNEGQPSRVGNVEAEVVLAGASPTRRLSVGGIG
jgi:hypothetical protein